MNVKAKEIEGEVIERPKAGQAVAVSQGNAITPMDMLDRALSSGATPETIEKFMAMAERYEQGQSRKAFEAALAETRSELRPITRNAKGHNDKKYVSLDAMAAAVDPILAAHGLSYRYRTQQTPTVITVTCILFGHGHSEESTLSGPADASGNKNAIQAIGSTLTYLQRYSLAQALGLAAASDDDGHSAADMGGLVDAAQLETIQKRIVEVGIPIANFCKVMKVESVDQVRGKDFKTALMRIKEVEDWNAQAAKKGGKS
jgi:hypothetical protein